MTTQKLKKFGVTTLSALLLMSTTGAVSDQAEDTTTQQAAQDTNDTTDRQGSATPSTDRDDKKASIVTSVKPVEYETTVVENDRLPAGAKVTVREGTEGERTTYRSYTERIQADGTKKMVPVKHSTMTVAPVNKIVLKGTNNTEISAMSEKALEREAERQADREAERQAERQAELDAEREARAAEAAERAATDAHSGSDSNNSGSGSSGSSSSGSSSSSSNGGSASVDTSTSAAAMKAQVAPGQVTTPSQNRAYAKAILSPADFDAADKLVRRESEWITTAANPNSSAYGVPQSLPGNKMASAGSDWRTNGMTQFDWMISYVEGRYGSFQNALQHSYTHGWY